LRKVTELVLNKILFDARWYGDHGIGRFAREIRKRLSHVTEFNGALAPYHPLDCFYSSIKLLSVNGPLFFSPGYSSPLYLRTPFAFTIHDLNHIDCPEQQDPLKAVYYERVMRPACKRALQVFTVSEYSRNRIAEWSGLDPARIVNIGNGVGAEFCPDGEHYDPGAPYIFCVGNRKSYKNELRALRAFAQTRSARSLHLLFLGTPSAELLLASRSLGLEKRVQFLGRLTDAQLASVYRGAVAILFPSLFEGFGLPVIEGMACGTPVITSTVCSLPEVAGGAALLVDPTSEEAIASALEQVINSAALRDQLRQRGFDNIRRFSWDESAQKLQATLEAAL